MKKDLIITFISYAFSFLCGILVYKVAAKSLGPEGFGIYALVRRASSFMEPVLIMGLGVGLTRYIAISSAKGGDNSEQASYIIAGYGSVLLFSAFVLTIINLMPGLLGKAVFGRPGYEGYVHIISFLGESYMVSSLVYSFYRGNGRFVAANLISISIGIVPLVSLLIAGSVKTALEMTTAGMFLVCFVFSFPIARAVLPHLRKVRLIKSTKELLRYGLARVPGDISMAGMLALPAFLTSNLFGIKEAGFVAFGVSLVTMVGAIFQPVGLITLPKMSAILSEGKHDEARLILQRIIKYTAITSIGVTAVLYLSTGYLVHYWLGAQFDEAAGIVRLAILAAVPNALYVALRSSIDAATVKAVNASNIYRALFVSAIAYIVVKAAHLTLSGIPLSFMLGMVLLCFLTIKVSLSTYGFNLKWSFRQ
jgi:O-antigen/teichoic acid export membrane protein